MRKNYPDKRTSMIFYFNFSTEYLYKLHFNDRTEKSNLPNLKSNCSEYLKHLDSINNLESSIDYPLARFARLGYSRSGSKKDRVVTETEIRMSLSDWNRNGFDSRPRTSPSMNLLGFPVFVIGIWSN